MIASLAKDRCQYYKHDIVCPIIQRLVVLIINCALCRSLVCKYLLDTYFPAAVIFAYLTSCSRFSLSMSATLEHLFKLFITSLRICIINDTCTSSTFQIDLDVSRDYKHFIGLHICMRLVLKHLLGTTT